MGSRAAEATEWTGLGDGLIGSEGGARCSGSWPGNGMDGVAIRHGSGERWCVQFRIRGPCRCSTALAEAQRTKLKDRRGVETEVTRAWSPGAG